MENQINELLGKVEYLEKLINTIQSNNISNIELTWTILSVVVATAGVALYALSKVWVNKRVDEELPKVIKDYPPILYFKGVLNKVQSVMDDHAGQMYTEGIIDIEKYNIKDLNFPIELDLFYYHKSKFTIVDEESKKTEKILDVKFNLEYNVRLTEHGIRIWYKEPHIGFGLYTEIMWTLKIPNPKYSHNLM